MVGINYTALLDFDLESLEIDVPIRTYVPIFDPLGPYLFYPPHCY